MLNRYIVKYNEIFLPHDGGISSRLCVTEVVAEYEEDAKKIVKQQFEVEAYSLTIKIDIIEVVKFVEIKQEKE